MAKIPKRTGRSRFLNSKDEHIAELQAWVDAADSTLRHLFVKRMAEYFDDTSLVLIVRELQDSGLTEKVTSCPPPTDTAESATKIAPNQG